jgi:hypothetical protein
MGFLTPVLIRNDALDLIKDPKYSQKFCDDLFSACCERNPSTISIAGFCNPVEVLGCKHADEPRLIVVKGNTMVELNPYKLPHRKNDFYENCANFAKKEASDFLKKYKE